LKVASYMGTAGAECEIGASSCPIPVAVDTAVIPWFATGLEIPVALLW
jgi:hypothetical protein